MLTKNVDRREGSNCGRGRMREDKGEGQKARGSGGETGEHIIWRAGKRNEMEKSERTEY